ncbi:hypothetical protein CPB86DRAFT_873778, partial [Serendipita vermifera]
MSKGYFSDAGLFNRSLAKRQYPWGTDINAQLRDALTGEWDAPPTRKAQLAVLVIWTIICFLQLALLIKQIRHVARAYRVPFILLATTTFFLGVGYIAYTFATRLRGTLILPPDPEWDFIFTYNFLYYTHVSSLPAVCLYLLHLRGDSLRTSQGTMFNPLMSRRWKKILDWVWIGLLYFLYVLYFSLDTRSTDGYNHQQIDLDTSLQLWRQSVDLEHVVVAFRIVAYLIVIISSAIMFMQVKKQGIVDPAIKRLFMGASPL